MLADISAHDEVQNYNVIVTIYYLFNEIFMHLLSTGMVSQGWRDEGGEGIFHNIIVT